MDAAGPFRYRLTVCEIDGGLMQVVKPREEYIMVIDADCILRKPFIPEELHLEMGKYSWYTSKSEITSSGDVDRAFQESALP